MKTFRDDGLMNDAEKVKRGIQARIARLNVQLLCHAAQQDLEEVAQLQGRKAKLWGVYSEIVSKQCSVLLGWLA